LNAMSTNPGTVQSGVGRVPVTAAVINRGAEVLVARRPGGGRHPGAWEFPGGKVEEGETARECLIREMREELGIEVAVGEELARVAYSYPDLAIELIAFSCEIEAGEPRDIGCSEHAWVEPAALDGFELLPADRELLRMLDI